LPVADTDLLFALSPRDPKHRVVLQLVRKLDIVVPDVVVLEFALVLRNRGKSPQEIRAALQALHTIMERLHLPLLPTLSPSLLSLACELEQRYQLTFFDSLVAATALLHDNQVVSDDKAFDKVRGLTRIPLTS